MKPKRQSPFKGRRQLDADLDPSWSTTDLSRYGFGYFNAGDLLARTIINAVTGEWKKWNLDDENLEWLVGDVYPSMLIFPLLNLYRHGTELMLKHFIYDRPNAPEFDDDAKRHRLDKLWIQAKPELLALGFKEKNPDILKIQAFVEKLNGLDANGEAVRFPTNYRGEIFFENHEPLNIEALYQEAREVRDLFYGLAEAHSELWSEFVENSIEMES